MGHWKYNVYTEMLMEEGCSFGFRMRKARGEELAETLNKYEDKVKWLRKRLDRITGIAVKDQEALMAIYRKNQPTDPDKVKESLHRR